MEAKSIMFDQDIAQQGKDGQPHIDELTPQRPDFLGDELVSLVFESDEGYPGLHWLDCTRPFTASKSSYETLSYVYSGNSYPVLRPSRFLAFCLLNNDQLTARNTVAWCSSFNKTSNWNNINTTLQQVFNSREQISFFILMKCCGGFTGSQVLTNWVPHSQGVSKTVFKRYEPSAWQGDLPSALLNLRTGL